MRLLIVGPQNSGKTVLAVALHHYLSEQRPELGSSLPLDWETNRYTQAALESLRNQEWPEATAEGVFTELNYKYSFAGRSFRATLIDMPGEQIQNAFSSKGGQDPHQIRKRMREAHILAVLLDISRLHLHDFESREMAYWLLQQALDIGLSSPHNVKTVILVPKADLLDHELPEDKWADAEEISAVFSQKFPRLKAALHIALTHPRAGLLMVSAVESEMTPMQTGGALRRPRLPLTSRGFDLLLDVLVKARRSATLKAGAHTIVSHITDITDKCKKSEKLQGCALHMLKAFILLLLLYLALFYLIPWLKTFSF